MTKQELRELMFSLSWCDCSNYHYERVKELLNGTGFDDVEGNSLIEMFMKNRVKIGKGSPR